MCWSVNVFCSVLRSTIVFFFLGFHTSGGLISSVICTLFNFSDSLSQVSFVYICFFFDTIWFFFSIYFGCFVRGNYELMFERKAELTLGAYWAHAEFMWLSQGNLTKDGPPV